MLNRLLHPTALFRSISAGMLLGCLSISTANAQTDKYPTAEIDKFFSTYLQTRKGSFDVDQPLTADEINAQQKAVWESWVKANKNFNEEQLISLESLSKAPSGKWKLPEALEANATMNYYYGTKGAKPTEGYPLFVYMHGSGQKDYEWSTGLSICQSFNDSPSLYFIPQIPNTGAYYRWWQKAKQFAWEKLLRMSYVEGNIDPNRVYFFGISEGGYGSQRLASFYADYLAGAGPMAGGEPLINAPVENCANIAFTLRTGAEDNGFYRNVLTRYANEAFNELEQKHPGYFVHHIEVIPHYGHGIDYRPTTPWLSQYKRNPYPKKVMWENFVMDGQKRSGFYNLYIEENPMYNANSLVYYTMNIEGNNIELTTKKVTYKTIESRGGISIKFSRSYSPTHKGKIRIFLNDKLIDMSKPITVTANGKLRYQGMVTPNLNDMVNSCARFFDPARVYPASVLIDLTKTITGVNEVEMDDDTEECYYDLSGRKVTHPQKGIYISNKGKKVRF